MEVIGTHLQDLKFFINQEMVIFGKENQAVRQVFTFSKTEKTKKNCELIIRNAENQYTEAYKRLTLEYHYNTLWN